MAAGSPTVRAMEETLRVSILGQVQAELRDRVIATVQEAVAA